MSMTLTQALRDPQVASDLQKYYRGDATKLEPAAKSGDIKAQELRTKIFTLMSGAPATDYRVMTSPTKSTTPQAVIPVTNKSNIPLDTWANKSTELLKGTQIKPQEQTPQPQIQGTQESNIQGQQDQGLAGYGSSESWMSMRGSQQPEAPDDSELIKARKEMEAARNAYVGAEGEALGFEDKLKAAIQKKADFFKSLNEKRGNIVSDLNTVDSRIREKYSADLKEDPFAMRKLMEQEKGMLERNLSMTDAELKQRSAYLDDIINAGVKAEEARIKVSKLSYEAKKEAYEQLKEERKDLMDYLEKNYEGPEVDIYKRQFLEMLGYTENSNLNLLNKALTYKPGSYGGQCGTFVNKNSGLQLGDSYEDKMSKMDPRITTPAPGMVFVMPSSTAKYKDNGHTGIILSIKDGMATVIDSNYDDNEKVKIHQIPISKMTGFSMGASTLTPKASTEKLTTEELKQKAREIVDDGKASGLSREDVENSLFRLNIDPASSYYKNYLDSVYGKKGTPPPEDLSEKSSEIAKAIQEGDERYVSFDAEGNYKDVKWTSIPAAYRDTVKKFLEVYKTPAELPWWAKSIPGTKW